MDKNIVMCVDCGAKLEEDVALIVRNEPKVYRCVDCHLKTI